MRRSPRRRDSGQPPRRNRQSGFALIAAVALLVVLGSASAIMLRMSATQQAGSTASILGARADWAARSGVDWALHQIVAMGDCPGAVTTLNLSEGVLAGYVVRVECSASSHFEGAVERKSFQLQSEATFGVLGSRDFVFREVQAAIVL